MVFVPAPVSSAPVLSRRPSTLRMAAALVEAGDVMLAQCRLTAIAVALRRFRLDHGAYPPSLDELVPSYLSWVPLDPFTDAKPAYTREGSGFALRAQVPHFPPPPGAVRVPGYGDPGEWKLAR